MTTIDWAVLADLPDEQIGFREEDIKFKVVAPLLYLLGYSALDCSFETPADMGRIDIAIKGFQVGVLIECKRPGAYLEDCVAQVEKYVRETMTRQHAAMLSVLTNGNGFVVYGVLEAIHKHELAEHKLFEFRRQQLKQPDTQATLNSLLARAVVGGPAEEARRLIDSALRAWKQAREEHTALLAQQERRRTEMRTPENQSESIAPTSAVSRLSSSKSLGQKGGLGWAKEYGDQEKAGPWISELLDTLVPVGSEDFVYRRELAHALCAFLEGRGTERAKAQSKEQRRKTAGNMVDWVSAQWTIGLGGKDSDQMQHDSSARVTDPDAAPWLLEFTARWTRKRTDKYQFGRR